MSYEPRTKPPEPVWALLANAPGPDKVPFFPARSGPKVSIVTEDREPTRALVHHRRGQPFAPGPGRNSPITRGWKL